MRVISNELKAHLAQTSTTVCTLVTINVPEGATFRYTDHNVNVTFEGNVFVPFNAVVTTDYTVTNELNSSIMDMTGFFIDGVITVQDILADYWRGASVKTEIVNYMDLSMGSMVLQIARLGLVEVKEHTYKIELKDRATLLDQTVGEIYKATCRVELGSGPCGVTLTPVNGTVSSVSSVSSFTDASRTEPDDWFTYGKVEWLTGGNTGKTMGIIRYKNKDVTVSGIMFANIQVGDTYKITVGCDKRGYTCRTKFNNLERFRGYPYMPGSAYYKQTSNNSKLKPIYDA